MPSINRIRVNNIKYNFGTQSYDDFTMRMYGKNTLYDLANGGGKSVLMLLLMQCVIPNSTLDDKQPIEKLFRGGFNTCIHSLVEWKLDPGSVKEGMRYMTTGFAAKKAGSQMTITDETASNDPETAEIEYFNYVIFYRNYNKHDIVNIPLSDGQERISYKGLRNFLQDISRNDKNIEVHIFDRKGEYQRFIAEYGLYESQWELIRGINRTEGHVRTYFETNYKTTRRVIEDLFIEEIIEKAYAVKTADDSTEKNKNTAELLLTIQDELKNLAQKKKSIAAYDHEAELITLLSDRIESFMSLFREKDKCINGFSEIYVSLMNERNSVDARKAELEEALKELKDSKLRYELQLEQLKLGKSSLQLDEAEAKYAKLTEAFEGEQERYKKLEAELNQLLAGDEYLELCRNQEKLELLKEEQQEKIKDSNAVDIGCIVYNIHKRMAEKLSAIREKAAKVEAEKEALLKEAESIRRLTDTALQEMAVVDSRIYDNSRRYQDGVERTKTLGSQLRTRDVCSMEQQLAKLRQSIGEKEQRRLQVIEEIEAAGVLLAELRTKKGADDSRASQLTREIQELETKRSEYRESTQKRDKLAEIYRSEDLVRAVQSAVQKDYIRTYEVEGEIRHSLKRLTDIRAGRLLRDSESVTKIIDYIITRHNKEAISGMDYLALQQPEVRKRLLKSNPGLAYGVVVDGLDKLRDDHKLSEIDNQDAVILYDKAELGQPAVTCHENALQVIREASFFCDGAAQDTMTAAEQGRLQNLKEELRSISAMLETKKQDLAFLEVYENTAAHFEERLRELKSENEKLENDRLARDKEIRTLEDRISRLTEEKSLIKVQLEEDGNDTFILEKLIEEEAANRKLLNEEKELRQEKTAIEEEMSRLRMKQQDNRNRSSDAEASYLQLKDEEKALHFEWDNRYSAYYTEVERTDMGLTLKELEVIFKRETAGKEGALSQEKEKLLIDTLNETVRRLSDSIHGRKVDIEELRRLYEDGSLYKAGDERLASLRKEIEAENSRLGEMKAELEPLKSRIEQMKGALEYARKKLEDTYGSESTNIDELISEVKDLELGMQQRQASVKQLGDDIELKASQLKELTAHISDNSELERFISRVLDKEKIVLDTTAEPGVPEGTDLREYFDNLIMEYDRIVKSIEKAKSDTVKVKLKVIDSLKELGTGELAASVRDEVDLPENTEQVQQLMERIREQLRLIKLERDRIENSLTGMQRLRDNFIEQCLERCLDVKAELEKISHLSEITLDNERVEMIKLKIPYVKPEYMKDRMTDYIDRVVSDMDKKETESERQKFLNQQLSMKRLFGVIVSDMNRIKLQLYKRERIREQSRYLRYEEAVGSTGQSQGIYIQFLISVINYISGMYALEDGQVRYKTIFIDNPFGAAKDIYIWEPIFRLLEENNVQLVVPTRGATPEITGRFDVNYILGQQKTGSRQTTVVVNYSSKTQAEELEYRDLDYEQVTFDFI